MGIYAGSDGYVSITRQVGSLPQKITIRQTDISTVSNRIQMIEAEGNFLPGDRLKMTSLSQLSFFAQACWPGGSVLNTAEVYTLPDDAGGFKFYASYLDAVNDIDPLPLTIGYPNEDIVVDISIIGQTPRLVSQVTEFTIRTGREQIDVGAIGESVTKLYTGRISGQGSLIMLFDCFYNATDLWVQPGSQPAMLFGQMLLRSKVGSGFGGQFVILKDPDTGYPLCWYESSCAVTDVGVRQRGDGIPEVTVEFVTLEDIRLRIRNKNMPYIPISDTENEPYLVTPGTLNYDYGTYLSPSNALVGDYGSYL